MTTATLEARELSDLTTNLADVVTPSELQRLVAEVHARPELWKRHVQIGADRWYARLHLDDNVEVWLISWPRETGTTLHDHGGSNGAFRVVAGTLHEDRPRAGRLERRAVAVGQEVAFGGNYVHDVANRGDDAAISLHAYSPPLATMTFYGFDEGSLIARGTENVAADRPEAEEPA